MGQKAGSGENVFRVNKRSVLEDLLVIEEVEKASLHLTLPGGLVAEVNHFDPAALVYEGRGTLFGLDRYCRLIPYDRNWENVDLPILTGLKLDGLFNAPADYRVAEVIDGLREIEEDLPEFYCQVAEIDFSDRAYLTVHLNSSRKRFLAGGADFARQMIKLHAVRTTDDWGVDGCYNLVYDGVVVREEPN